jgi:hypothetical protein
MIARNGDKKSGILRVWGREGHSGLQMKVNRRVGMKSNEHTRWNTLQRLSKKADNLDKINSENYDAGLDYLQVFDNFRYGRTAAIVKILVGGCDELLVL